MNNRPLPENVERIRRELIKAFTSSFVADLSSDEVEQAIQSALQQLEVRLDEEGVASLPVRRLVRRALENDLKLLTTLMGDTPRNLSPGTAAVARPAAHTSEELGRYNVTGLLGHGGFGRVCKAQDPMLERPVAVKVLEPRKTAGHNAEAFTRFWREGQAVGRLQHENIIVLHDAHIGNAAGGSNYLVFDCAEGGSLSNRIQSWRAEAQLVAHLADDETASLLGDSDEPVPHRPPRAAEVNSEAHDQTPGRTHQLALAQFEKERPARFKQIARWAREIASGLQHSHMHGVCHRDIKPANILLTTSGGRQVAKVGDFGLAWVSASDAVANEEDQPGIAGMSAFQEDRELSLDGVAGTPIYMDPAVLQHCRDTMVAMQQREASPGGNPLAAGLGFRDFAMGDQYGLGLIMYQMLTLTHPYDDKANQPSAATPQHHAGGGELLRMLDDLLSVAPRPVKALNPHAPTPLALICEKAISRDPAARYPGMEELANDLDSYLRDGDYTGIRLPLPVRIVRWCRRNTAVLIAMLLLTALVGLASGGSYFVWREQQKSIQAEASSRLSRHNAAVSDAREASARGDWAAAEAFYAAAIAHAYADAPELEVEQVNAYIALHDRGKLSARLNGLAERKEISARSMAWITLLRGQLLLTSRNEREGCELLQQALDTRMLSRADQALARGLLAKTADEAIPEFERAVQIEPFHYGANSALAVALLSRGRLDDARAQAIFMQKAFPDDTRPVFVEAFTMALNGDQEGAIARLKPLKTRIEPDRIQKMIQLVEMTSDYLDSKPQSLIGLATPARTLKTSTPIFDELGVWVASWAFDSVLEFLQSLMSFSGYVRAKELGVRRAPLILDGVIEQVDEAIRRNPDAAFLYLKATCQLMRMVEHFQRNENKEAQVIAVAMHKTACQGAASTSVWPSVRYQSALLALSTAGVTILIEEEAPAEAAAINARTWALMPQLIHDGRRYRKTRAEQLSKLTERVLCDVEACRILLLHWRKEEPGNPLAAASQAKLEARAGNTSSARLFAQQALALSKPGDAVHTSMKQLLATHNDKSPAGEPDPSSAPSDPGDK